MKKISKTNANKIYGLVKDITSKGVEVELDVLDNKDRPIKVTVYPFVSAATKSVIVDDVVEAAMIDGEYNRIYRDVQMARCVIEHMTDIPLPTKIDSESKEEYIDLNVCYDLVHRILVDSSIDLWTTYSDIIELVMDKINSINRTSEIAAAINVAAPGQLAQKVLDLYELLKAELRDLEDNPARISELIESIPDDKLEELAKILGIEEEKVTEVKPEFSVVK